jgi:hypothetical protein
MTVADDIAAGTGPLFLAAEVELYQPGTLTVPEGQPWATLPWGTLTALAQPVESTDTLRASDAGWVTLPDDAPGQVIFPPTLLGSFEIDRQIALAPNGAGAGAAWGALRLANPGGTLDATFTGRNVDGRAISLRIGRKAVLAHGYAADPAWAETMEIFAGLGAGLALEEAALRVELRDAGYWLERRGGGETYSGAGGLAGTDALKGKRKPRVRGGTSTAPVRNVTPVLVDPAALIYQYTDAAGTVVALYEGGLAGGITSAGNVSDLYGGSTPAGQYRTDNAKGLFQLGSTPARQITVDCTGAFPDAATPSTAALIALDVLLQDAAVPSLFVDTAAFGAVDAAAPWVAGFHLGLDQPLDAVEIVGRLLASIGARLVPLRNGRLSAVLLRAPAPGAIPAYAYDEGRIVACLPRRLSAPLDPPPFRFRVGFARNHTVQTSDIAPTVAAERRQVIAEPWQVASAASSDVLAGWRLPSDPDVLDTDLLAAADAQALADVLVALWCSVTPRRVYDVTVPLPQALRHGVGDLVRIAFPVAGLAGGALGLVVGEQLRGGDGTATFQVLT